MHSKKFLSLSHSHPLFSLTHSLSLSQFFFPGFVLSSAYDEICKDRGYLDSCLEQLPPLTSKNGTTGIPNSKKQVDAVCRLANLIFFFFLLRFQAEIVPNFLNLINFSFFLNEECQKKKNFFFVFHFLLH